MIPAEDLLYIPTLREGRLPMIALEEVPGSGFIHDAATLTWVPINGVEEYLDRNYVIIDDPSQVAAFEHLQKESGSTPRLPRKAGKAALGFTLTQFAVPVFLIVGIAILAFLPPFHASIGPFSRATAGLINNLGVILITGIGGSYALVRVLRQVDFLSAPLPAYAGLTVGLAWLGVVVFHVLVV